MPQIELNLFRRPHFTLLAKRSEYLGCARCSVYEAQVEKPAEPNSIVGV